MFAGKIVGWRRACGGGDTLNWKLELPNYSKVYYKFVRRWSELSCSKGKQQQKRCSRGAGSAEYLDLV